MLSFLSNINLLACNILMSAHNHKKMSKIVYLYVRPLFLYYFLLIATMTKTMFVNSQQISCDILLICEVVTSHKIIIQSFYFFYSLFLFLKIIARKKIPQLKTNLYQITLGLDYIEGTQSKTQSLIILKLYSTKPRYNQKDRTKKNDKGKGVVVIRYRGTSPKLGSCQGECHTHVFMSLSLEVMM